MAAQRTTTRLPSFLYFIVEGDEEFGNVEHYSWHDAIAHAGRIGETSVVGVTWNARQRLNLDGSVTTTTQEAN